VISYGRRIIGGRFERGRDDGRTDSEADVKTERCRPPGGYTGMWINGGRFAALGTCDGRNDLLVSIERRDMPDPQYRTVA